MRLKGIEKGAGKTEIALHKLSLILWTIDTCEVENEVAL